ncbi:DUF4142 domain-containing protein [Sandarakinorhabdus sp. DWP1-3-1]|uniref:DUF4142 domain-containing protein n=1 Tax=Sandarakinorhabdus sp. DWP1-3-1 TaxID=2804627 RepID=UPI003CF61410
MKHLVFAATLLVASAGMADEPPFLAMAAQDDLAEAAIGRLAEAQGLSNRVREFGRMLVTDHDAHLNRVSELAEARRIKLPEVLDPDQRAAYERLSLMQGAAFDEAFKARMIADRGKDIARYRAQLGTGDGEVAALARETLPVLERQLAAAGKL